MDQRNITTTGDLHVPMGIAIVGLPHWATLTGCESVRVVGGWCILVKLCSSRYELLGIFDGAMASGSAFQHVVVMGK